MKKLIVSEVGFRKILIIHTIIFNYKIIIIIILYLLLKIKKNILIMN